MNAVDWLNRRDSSFLSQPAPIFSLLPTQTTSAPPQAMWAEPQQRPPQRVSEATGCVIGRPRAIVTPEKQLLLDEKAARKSAREARKAEALAGGPPATRKRKADGGEAARVGRPPDTPEVRQAKALAKAEAKAAQQALESAEDPDGSIREAVQRARLEASAARRRQKREDASKVGVVEPQVCVRLLRRDDQSLTTGTLSAQHGAGHSPGSAAWGLAGVPRIRRSIVVSRRG